MVTCREVASVQQRAEAPAHGRGGEEWLPACRMRCLLLCGPRTLHSIRLSQGCVRKGEAHLRFSSYLSSEMDMFCRQGASRVSFGQFPSPGEAPLSASIAVGR